MAPICFRPNGDKLNMCRRTHSKYTEQVISSFQLYCAGPWGRCRPERPDMHMSCMPVVISGRLPLTPVSKTLQINRGKRREERPWEKSQWSIISKGRSLAVRVSDEEMMEGCKRGRSAIKGGENNKEHQ